MGEKEHSGAAKARDEKERRLGEVLRRHTNGSSPPYHLAHELRELASTVFSCAYLSLSELLKGHGVGTQHTHLQMARRRYTHPIFCIYIGRGLFLRVHIQVVRCPPPRPDIAVWQAKFSEGTT